MRNEEEVKEFAVTPFCRTVLGCVVHLLKKAGIKTICHPPDKLGQLMRPVKDDPELEVAGVYIVSCVAVEPVTLAKWGAPYPNGVKSTKGVCV